MQSARILRNIQCPHAKLEVPQGLAVVTIGNPLRGDDGVATAICSAMPEATTRDVCRFDLGTYTGFLGDCLSGHKAAIIIDSTSNGTAPGTVSILDLGTLLDRTAPLALRSCHGFSLADELRLAKKHAHLPKRIIFFGVEIADIDWNEKLSPALQEQLPHLVLSLSNLVTRVVEALKRDA